MHRRPYLLLASLLLVATSDPAHAAGPSTYRLDPGGRIQAARAVDLDGDGRRDLVMILQKRTEAGGTRQELLLLRAPSTPAAKTYYRAEDTRRISLEEGPASRAGVVSVGAFGPEGETRIRFLAADGIHDLDAQGRALPRTPRDERASLFARTPGRDIVFWDGHADLDGDGREECWFPIPRSGGRLFVHSVDESFDRILHLPLPNRAASDEQNRFIRYTRIPRLAAADLDGDGQRELVARDGNHLVAWRAAGPAASILTPPFLRVALPFDKADLGPDEIHTPRVQLADVDADGKADLLVTLVTGDRTQLGSFRTRLIHFPGPFVAKETGELVPPSIRIDTESVALHPRFLDVDGDGTLDYVSDSILGGKRDLLLRVLGQDPTIWHAAFLFDREAGTFERQPYFKLERPYSREEAVGNHFGVSAFFSGDFDGDGHKDMLDLGNLNGLEVLGAVKRQDESAGVPVTFTERIMPRARITPSLVADAVIADLDGNGLADAVVWNESTMFLVLPRRDP